MCVLSHNCFDSNIQLRETKARREVFNYYENVSNQAEITVEEANVHTQIEKTLINRNKYEMDLESLTRKEKTDT